MLLEIYPEGMMLQSLSYKHRKTINDFFIVSLFFFLCFTAGQGLAHSEVLNSKVKLATGEGYSPFVDDNLPDGGWSTSLVKLTFNKLNFAVEIDILPWSRALKWTQDGKFLATFPFVYSAQRAEHFLFSKPINFVPVHMYVAGTSSFTSAEQLKNKRLCFPLSYSLDSLEQGIVDKYQMQINRVKDGIGCVKHVQKGWSDAGLTNGYIHADKLPKNEADDNSVVIFPEQLALVPLYVVISKDYPNAEQWLAEFDYAFSLIEKSPEKLAIDQQYLDLINNPQPHIAF